MFATSFFFYYLYNGILTKNLWNKIKAGRRRPHGVGSSCFILYITQTSSLYIYMHNIREVVNKTVWDQAINYVYWWNKKYVFWPRRIDYGGSGLFNIFPTRSILIIWLETVAAKNIIDILVKLVRFHSIILTRILYGCAILSVTLF